MSDIPLNVFATEGLYMGRASPFDKNHFLEKYLRIQYLSGNPLL